MPIIFQKIDFAALTFTPLSLLPQFPQPTHRNNSLSPMAGIIVQKTFIIANLTQNNSHTPRRRVWRISPNGHQQPPNRSHQGSNRSNNLRDTPRIYRHNQLRTTTSFTTQRTNHARPSPLHRNPTQQTLRLLPQRTTNRRQRRATGIRRHQHSKQTIRKNR